MFSNVMVWILSNISINLTLTDNINTSLAATLSKYLSPILIPLGITNEYSWIIVFALITGFIAKELFLTTILTITGVESLRQALELLRLNPPSVAALTIFVTLYVPCIATISTIHIESKNYKLTLGTTLLMIIVAFTVSAIVYAFLNIIT